MGPLLLLLLLDFRLDHTFHDNILKRGISDSRCIYGTIELTSDNLSLKFTLILSELPWADCNNDWNTDKCRNPYEVKFNESCKMSDDYHPCAMVGAKYGDCKVRRKQFFSCDSFFVC